jgi:hypothetical protein
MKINGPDTVFGLKRTIFPKKGIFKGTNAANIWICFSRIKKEK